MLSQEGKQSPRETRFSFGFVEQVSHSHYLHALLSEQPQISSAAFPRLLLDKWHSGEKVTHP